MRRDARAMTLNYKGQSITFDMPGWYCDASDQSTHTGEDMKVSDLLPSRAISSALALLDNDPKSLQVLEARYHPAEGHQAQRSVQRSRYMTLESISTLSNDPLVSLPAAAV
jgi:HTH-type transcriptional regulator/antitoxin MqsA